MLLARARRKALSFVASCTLLAAFASACGKRDRGVAPVPSSSAVPEAPTAKALTPEQAQQVLAQVGDVKITLGDYAASLERMDSFERLRYQSPERRRLLLNEMIDLELLAQEARRRGLDQQPETQERLRQLLREELLRQVRKEVPAPNDVAPADVRKYYDEHKADFDEPERRRVAHISVASRAQAEALLEKAKNASAADWGKLVVDNSLDKGSRAFGAAPPELAGDLGIVGPPGHARGANPRVPEPLRTAAFKIDKVGSVYPEVVADGGVFHIVRLTSRTDARERTYEAAERTIRISIVQELVKQREASFEKELRAKYPVNVDEAALAKVHVPKPSPSAGAGVVLPTPLPGRARP
ncbi:MAG TPA: peptidylprolyl isomerase [Polyangiaceae bacterium]|nr:peptidylprolyl isomerase [Polyangiaceae bacterium]